MKVFLLDLWLDLRAKRLAPVAVVLLVAIVAVPVVLAKKNDEAPPAPVPSTTSASAATAVVASDAQAGSSSKLQTYGDRDPFEPTSKATATTTSTTTSSPAPSSSSTSPSPSSGSSSSTSKPAVTTPPSSSGTGGGGATTGSQPTTGSSGGSGANGAVTPTPETKTTLFTYTVDLRFGVGGSVKAYKDVQRLDLIPDAANTKAVFLGVTTSGKTAVFLIDSSHVGVDTGGRCRPSGNTCTFLYLRPDSDHDQAVLTGSDGTLYHMRLLGIHRVAVSSVTSTGGGSTSWSNSSKGAKATTGRADRNKTSDQQSPFQQFFADTSQTQTR